VAEQTPLADLTALVGGQRSDARLGEIGGRAFDDVDGRTAVAINEDHDVAFAWTLPGDQAKRGCQRIALAGAGDAIDDQPCLFRHPGRQFVEPADQALVRGLDHGGNDGGIPAGCLGGGEDRPIDPGRNFRFDLETRHQEEGMGGDGLLAIARLCGFPPCWMNQADKDMRAHEVDEAPAIAPGTDQPDGRGKTRMGRQLLERQNQDEKCQCRKIERMS